MLWNHDFTFYTSITKAILILWNFEIILIIFLRAQKFFFCIFFLLIKTENGCKDYSINIIDIYKFSQRE